MSDVVVSTETEESSKVIVHHELKKYKISLYRNGNNPNIYYYFRYEGVSYQGSTGSNELETSKTIVPEIFYELTKGIRKKGSRRIIKFKHVVKKFIQYKEGQNLSSNTLVDYRLKSNFLIEKFGDEDITLLCSKGKGLFLDYQEWRRQYYEKHQDKRRQTYKKGQNVIQGRQFNNVGNVPINRECRLLVSIMRFSKEYMNLLQGIEIPRYTIIREEGRKGIFTYRDYKRLEKYWKEKEPYYWKIISFVDKTGIRYPSELNRILWKDVHIKEGYVEIRNRKSRSVPINTSMPLLGETKTIIEELRSREDIPKGLDEPVFVNDSGIQIKNITKSFKKSLSDLGINENFSMYTFRHTFTTRMVKNPEIPLKMLSYILGHRDTTMLDRQYSHIEGRDVVRTFQRLEDKKNKK